MKIYREFKIIEGTWALDPFKEDEVWINRRWFGKYFKENYDLEQFQVWNILNGFDKNQKHYCKLSSCDKEVNFISLSKGFQSFCNSSHGLLYRYESDPKFYESVLSRSRNIGTQFTSPVSLAKSGFTKFMKLGNSDDTCVFYFAITDSSEYPFKFGITHNFQNRMNYYGDSYKSIHKVLINTRLFVASLERDLKLYLNQNHEWFTSSKFKLIKSFIKSYELI